VNKYFVYIYLDPRYKGNFIYKDVHLEYEPFYVGIGKTKNRHLSHLYEAYKLNCKCHKCKKIRKIKNKIKKDPIIIKLFENITKSEALRLEVSIIKDVGRYDLKTGPLTNKTSGGDGVVGNKLTKEQKIKQSIRIKRMHKEKPWLSEEHSIKIKKVYKDNPQISENISSSVKKLWKNKKYIEKQKKSHIEFYKNNEWIRKKISEESKIRFLKEEYKDKLRDSNSKIWIITYPNGKEVEIKNLSLFCRENNIQRFRMDNIKPGNEKNWNGWKCKLKTKGSKYDN